MLDASSRHPARSELDFILEFARTLVESLLSLANPTRPTAIPRGIKFGPS